MAKLFSILLIFLSFAEVTYSKTRYASYNIRNFDYDVRSNTPTNKKHLISIIENVQPDFMAVQEINQGHTFNNMIDTYFQGSYESILTECGGAHDQKLGFVYNTKKFKLINFDEDTRTVIPGKGRINNCRQGSRPLAVGTFKIIDSGELLVAISVHLKSGSRPNSIRKRYAQLDIINTVVKEHKMQGIKNFVIMGDFNSTEYIKGGKYKNQFMASVNQMGMIDTTSHLSCSAYWWGGKRDQRQYPSILDHIIVSPELIKDSTPKVESYGHCQKLKCQVTSDFEMGVSYDEVSDHCPLVTTIN